MSKSPEIESFLEELAGRSTALAGNKCLAPPLGCGGDASKFRDGISAREYRISGFCQTCQDSVFGFDGTEADCEAAPYDVNNPKSEVIKEAVSKGLVVFDATDAVGQIITLDLDKGSEDSFFLHRQCTDIFGEGNFKGLLVQSKNHATKGSKHAYVYLTDAVTPELASYLAKHLGSDEIREAAALDYYRKSCAMPGAYLMFETPKAAVEVRKWLAELELPWVSQGVKEVTE